MTGRRVATVVVGVALGMAGLTATAAASAGPAVTVTPSTDVDPAGQTLTVAGSGFDPNKNNGVGVYVVFGPRTDNYWLNANAYQASKWVHKNGNPSGGQDRLNADGTFTTTLPDIKATYTDGDGNQVDCTAIQCYVITFAAHGSADRSQDTFTPVTFRSTNPDPGPPAATAEQSISVAVQAGGLSLSVAGSAVSLQDTTLGKVATGQLHKATVADLRGTSGGWSLVGEVTQFTASGGTIAANQLGWAPTAQAMDGGQVTPGGAVQPGGGLGTPKSLCSSAAGASAGTFECGAQLNLGTPATAAPGAYTGTLTLTLA